MRVRIDKIYHNETDRNGQPLINKNGRPYSKCVIVSGDTRYYGFDNKTTKGWKEGDEVEIEVTENNGYKNFRLPDPNKLLLERIEALEAKIEEQEIQLDMIRRYFDEKS